MTKKDRQPEQTQPGAKELADILKLAYQARTGVDVPEQVGRQIDAGAQAAYNLGELVKRTDERTYNALTAIAIADLSDKMGLHGDARMYANRLARTYAEKGGIGDEPKQGPSAGPAPSPAPAYTPKQGAGPDNRGPAYAPGLGEVIHSLLGARAGYRPQ